VDSAVKPDDEDSMMDGTSENGEVQCFLPRARASGFLHCDNSAPTIMVMPPLPVPNSSKNGGHGV
jgi:hypothetical protein